MDMRQPFLELAGLVKADIKSELSPDNFLRARGLVRDMAHERGVFLLEMQYASYVQASRETPLSRLILRKILRFNANFHEECQQQRCFLDDARELVRRIGETAQPQEQAVIRENFCAEYGTLGFEVVTQVLSDWLADEPG